MDLSKFFQEAINNKASDIHLVAGSIPAHRINGELLKLNHHPLDGGELEKAIYSLIDNETMEKFKKKKELDFSREFFGSRFRLNLHFQEGKIALAGRLVPKYVPKPEEIDFSEVIYKLTHLQDGLILVTGPSGNGKTTTLATMIDIINQERKSHIITIEDPIEYMFEEKQSIIEQREVGLDTNSFARALKYALREDPNVIMVGELRDLETISACLTAAETGHLVLSTLHTATAPETISRIVDVFPAHQQQEVLNMFSTVLRAIITQQLLPKIGGGRVVAREILINNPAISSLIRRNQIGQILSVIQTSHQDGMVTMNKSIDQLYGRGLITEETVNNRKRNMETQAVYY
jgi:twitching motility protein PilT